MSDEKTYTLAEVRVLQREAYRRACLNESMSYDRAEELARTAYPDPEPPEPERRWVETAHQTYCARDPDGSWWTRSEDGKVFRAWQYGDVLVAALASLLPRVPVEVTEAMLEKAKLEYWAYKATEKGWHDHFLRAAVEAVAVDLAQPVTICQHKAQWWGVIAPNTIGACLGDEGKARALANGIPHSLVLALAEVEG